MPGDPLTAISMCCWLTQTSCCLSATHAACCPHDDFALTCIQDARDYAHKQAGLPGHPESPFRDCVCYQTERTENCLCHPTKVHESDEDKGQVRNYDEAVRTTSMAVPDMSKQPQVPPRNGPAEDASRAGIEITFAKKSA